MAGFVTSRGGHLPPSRASHDVSCQGKIARLTGVPGTTKKPVPGKRIAPDSIEIPRTCARSYDSRTVTTSVHWSVIFPIIKPMAARRFHGSAVIGKSAKNTPFSLQLFPAIIRHYRGKCSLTGGAGAGRMRPP